MERPDAPSLLDGYDAEKNSRPRSMQRRNVPIAWLSATSR